MMTATRLTQRPTAPHGPAIVQAVRHAVRAIKNIQDEQTYMWEAFWRSSRFPGGNGDDAGLAA